MKEKEHSKISFCCILSARFFKIRVGSIQWLKLISKWDHFRLTAVDSCICSAHFIVTSEMAAEKVIPFDLRRKDKNGKNVGIAVKVDFIFYSYLLLSRPHTVV